VSTASCMTYAVVHATTGWTLYWVLHLNVLSGNLATAGLFPCFAAFD
jgi:hypothetical protein